MAKLVENIQMTSSKDRRSLFSFSEKICKVSTIEEFLLFLTAHLPKKFKIGEVILFYESKQFGLRRAYIRSGMFYEEAVKNIWSVPSCIDYASKKETYYVTQEMGRIFHKMIQCPFFLSSQIAFYGSVKPCLFLEILQASPKDTNLQEYLREVQDLLELVLNRILLNTSVSLISYLWSSVFGKYGEPLAILKDSQVMKSNHPFDHLISIYPQLLDLKKNPKLLNVKNKIYQIHYYPIPELRDFKDVGIFYCQDMTVHYDLKEKFFQSEKMSAFYELGRNIAHELNNPLTGIRSMSQILSHYESLKMFSEDFKAVEQATARSQKIIDNLLTFSQQKKQDFCYCCLNEVVKDTLPLLKTMTSGIEIELKNFSKSQKVVGDFSALQQVIYNLIINSCQALKDCKKQEQSKIIIHLDQQDSKVILQIRDNGPGIQHRYLEKIFQPLWTTKKEGEGTGLGLGISRQIVRKYGGELELCKEFKDWTCFSISLPCQVNNK